MPLDIVIFGVIAVILIFRFLGVLGQNDKSDGRERRDAFGGLKKHYEAKEKERLQREEEKAKIKQQQGAAGGAGGEEKARIKQPQGSTGGAGSEEKAKIKQQQGSAGGAGGVVDVKDKAFLESAKAVFGMILESYAAGDQANLEALLDKELLERMKGDIEQRQKAEHRLEISLHEIIDAQVVERKQDERFEQITVSFTSKQCHLLFDKDNKLIEGDPDEEELLSDLWTFRQDVTSQDPTWFLCAASSQDTSKKKAVARKKASAKKSPREKILRPKN